MARKRQDIYGSDTLKKVQLAWNIYKDKTGATQASAAKSMGMGTSGFNQYLKGPDQNGVPLNTNFLIKFARMVGMEPSKLAPELSVASVSLRPTTVILQVRLTLAGRKPVNRSVVVDSIGVVSTETTFAVEVDVDSSQSAGSMLIVSTTEQVEEGDMVIIAKEGTAPVFGKLNFDAHESIWWVAQALGNSVIAYNVQEEDKPWRVVGVQYPRQAAKRAFGKV